MPAFVDALVQDARHGLRAVRHSPGSTIWLVASLAIGMAVVTAGFAFLVALLIGPFPTVVQQWRLVRISMSENCGRPDCWRQMASPDEFAALQSLTGLNGVSAYTFGQVMAVAPDIASMPAAFVSPTYFDVLGARAVLGRVFSASDEAGRVPVAMLSHRMWTRDFGSDPTAIGRTIRVADTFVEIVGVTPEFFVGIDLKSARGDNGPALWLPLWLADSILPIASGTQGTPAYDLSFVGRLRDGIGVGEVHSQANVLARQLSLHRGNHQGARAYVRRVWRTDPENWGIAVMLLMPIPLLVLAIACINAANLMLARALERGREVAVRLAIGSGRNRIVRQLLFESTILAALATIAAAPFAHWAFAPSIHRSVYRCGSMVWFWRSWCWQPWARPSRSDWCPPCERVRRIRGAPSPQGRVERRDRDNGAPAAQS